MERSPADYYKILKRDITKFFELKINYLKLEFAETFSTIFSHIVTIIVVLLMMIITFSFLLIALGFYLGKILHGYHWGFLIVAGIFLITALIFVALRKKIIVNPLINAFIELLFEDNDFKNRNLNNEK